VADVMKVSFKFSGQPFTIQTEFKKTTQYFVRYPWRGGDDNIAVPYL
jgi:hypothetical protein